jgi:hypothetical protein
LSQPAGVLREWPYAPISLPYDIDVLPQYGTPVAFSSANAASLLPVGPNNTIEPPAPPAADATILPGTTAAILQENKSAYWRVSSSSILQPDRKTARHS